VWELQLVVVVVVLLLGLVVAGGQHLAMQAWWNL
jgi:hypothetical protein